MKKIVKSPFFTIKENKLLYLNQCKICELPREEKIRKDILIKEGAIFEIDNYKRINKSVLVLEPHPDDYALSALAYTINFENVQVLNIFTKTKLEYFPWITQIKLNQEEYEKLRIEESKFAIENILKQNFITLQEKSLRITNKKEEKVKELIINAIVELLNKNPDINTILVPMGVGEHPDHIMIYNTVMENYNLLNKYKIILYPEYPYIRSKKNFYKRLDYVNQYVETIKIKNTVDKYIDTITNAIISYKSQFIDINREQMLAIVREDSWGVGQDYGKEELDFFYYQVEGKK